MKKAFFFLFVLISVFVFSQLEKEGVKVTDSVKTKYPDRTEELSDVVEIYSLSEPSKEAVKKKVRDETSKYQLKDLTKSGVDNIIAHYQMNYIWLITDKIFSNFEKEEILSLKKLVKKKRKDILLDRFLRIEQECIEDFNKKFE